MSAIHAKAKAHNISETTRKAMDDEIAAEVEAAELEFDNKQAIADESIAKVRAGALANIDSVAIETANAVVEKIAKLKLSAAQVKAAISSAKG